MNKQPARGCVPARHPGIPPQSRKAAGRIVGHSQEATTVPSAAIQSDAVAQQFEMEGGEDEVEYQKPEVVRVVEAAVAIEGMKPGTVLDNNHPSSPPRSTGAYLSDE